MLEDLRTWRANHKVMAPNRTNSVMLQVWVAAFRVSRAAPVPVRHYSVVGMDLYGRNHPLKQSTLAALAV